MQHTPRRSTPVVPSLLLLVSALFSAGPASAASETGADIALWSSASATQVGREQLHQAITTADYLILGEIHDNPHHHQLQAELLGHFADTHGNTISVGFEQLTVDQQPLLDAFFEKAPVAADSLGDAVAWQDSGWPDYLIYRPLFAAALQRRLQVVPLMFSPGVTRNIMHDGVGAVLPDAALARLRPDTLLSAEERLEVESDMQDAHCGKLPESMLPAMVDVQIARDAFMAHSIVGAAERGVIITGNGHARRDRGIPQFLQRLRPDARIVVVTLLERSEDESLEQQARHQAQAAITDYAAFTPAHPRGDPCLAFQ